MITFHGDGLVKIRLAGDDEFMEWYGQTLFGGEFGVNEWALVATPIHYSRLPAIHYFVAHIASGFPLCTAKETKREARAAARHALKNVDRDRLLSCISTALVDMRRLDAKINAEREAKHRELAELSRDTKKSNIRTISKKRQQIFDRSQGKCHYCAIELEIAGRWHVEHMLPRSRGGTDLPDNLVASCVKCNYTKGTKTHDEFVGAAKKA